MDDTDVTQWIAGLVEGDESAARHLWDQYYQRLVHLARRKLGDSSRRVADEEDVVVSAFDSFCRAAAAGRFPRLDDRDDLWKVLLTITIRKAIAHMKHSHRQKRGSGAVRGESVFIRPDSSSAQGGVNQVLGVEPTPEEAVLVAEQFAHLLDCLDDDMLRRVAIDKLEGYSTEEIAQRLDRAPRTIERKLERIRDIWSRQNEASDP